MSDIFPDAAPPKTYLGRYRLLSPNASVRVSPLCLGTMNFGTSWRQSMGTCDKDTAFEILDYYYDAGGNFIDTSGNYQKGESETWLGEWMKARGVRDEIVLATKFTTNYRAGYSDREIIINRSGNGTKSLHLALENSLKNLQTSYVDILYVHWWDFTCSIAELMQSLDVIIRQGKALYLGISDSPAWVVAKCNEYARHKGLRQFSIYQGQWSAEHRDFERDIIPMGIDDGMAFCPWGALGSGNFKTAEQRAQKEDGRNYYELTPGVIAISEVLERIANEKNTQITSIALAYVMQKTPYVFPVIGGRKIEHLKGNIEGLKVRLTEKDIEDIEAAQPFDPGFPHNFLGGPRGVRSARDVVLVKPAGHVDYVTPLQPIVLSDDN